MDRENLWAKGWSHVLSTTNDVTELREDGQVWVRDYPPGSDPPAGALDRKLAG